MKDLHLKALKAYVDMLTIHIDTKTTDMGFHKETEAFYEVLFQVAHDVGEKYVDLGGRLSESTLEEKKNKANEIIRNLKKEIENYKNTNEVSLGTEDLLGTLASNLENIEGNSKVFLK